MATRTYQAAIEFDPASGNTSIAFPAFPAITSVAERPVDIARQAGDALATGVEFMQAEGMTLPPCVEEGAIETIEGGWLLVPVEVQGRAVRIQVSMEEGLLSRLDNWARQSGLSRSAAIARGVRDAMNERRPY